MLKRRYFVDVRDVDQRNVTAKDLFYLVYLVNFNALRNRQVLITNKTGLC